MKIGFIGLGIMGSRMAANLQKAGHELVVYNRTREKAEALLASGAKWMDTPAQLGAHCPIVITMLSTPEVVEETAAGSEGFLAAMDPGSLWVDCSTVNPAFSRSSAQKAAQYGVRFLEAPVAGSKGPAEKGELIILVGGHEKDLLECQPLFDAMGKRTIHAGGHGMGASLKLVFNLLLGETLLAFSEALVFGEAMGLTRSQLFDALLGSVVVPPYISGKRAKFENEEYSPEFPLQWMHKDLQLAAFTAYQNGAVLPGLNTTKEVFAFANQRGWAEDDITALFAFLKNQSSD